MNSIEVANELSPVVDNFNLKITITIFNVKKKFNTKLNKHTDVVKKKRAYIFAGLKFLCE